MAIIVHYFQAIIPKKQVRINSKTLGWTTHHPPKPGKHHQCYDKKNWNSLKSSKEIGSPKYIKIKILFQGTMFHQKLKICHWWFFVDCDSSEMFYKMAPIDTEEEDAMPQDMSLPQSSFDFTRGQSLRRRQRRRRVPRRPQNYNRKKRFGSVNFDQEIDTIKKEIIKMLSLL